MSVTVAVQVEDSAVVMVDGVHVTVVLVGRKVTVMRVVPPPFVLPACPESPP